MPSLFSFQIVNQFESMVKEEVKIDPRVHSMIIGKRGRTIHKIMDDFKVEPFIFYYLLFFEIQLLYLVLNVLSSLLRIGQRFRTTLCLETTVIQKDKTLKGM